MKNLHIFSSAGILFYAKCIEKMNKNTLQSKFSLRLASDDLQLEIYRNFLHKKTLSYSEKVPTKLCSEVIRGRNQNAASRAASDDLG